MKKAVVLISALFLFASLAIAQEPQKPVKQEEATKSEQTTKSKSECATVKECAKAKSSSGCCAHGKTADKPAKEDPGKK